MDASTVVVRVNFSCETNCLVHQSALWFGIGRPNWVIGVSVSEDVSQHVMAGGFR